MKLKLNLKVNINEVKVQKDFVTLLNLKCFLWRLFPNSYFVVQWLVWFNQQVG